MASSMEGTRLPGEWATTWLIGQRGAVEALHDRMTLGLNLAFALIVPTFIVISARQLPTMSDEGLGGLLVLYLLVVGLMPATGAVGIAAGQFAGEKEHGNLAPLLATPASNLAIFGGKILAAVLPALLFALIATLTYLLALLLLHGPARLALLRPELALGTVALVPAMAILGATLASLISSRVRTYNTAQQLTGLALTPIWGLLLALSARLSEWGAVAVWGAALLLLATDILLITLAAATWRREEVLASR